MGIRKASKAEIPIWSAAELGLEGDLKSAVTWPDVWAPPKIETECEFVEGETPEEIAAKLVDRLIEEKVV